VEQKKKVSLRKWWREARPTKTAVFWSWVGSIVLTMIIGFAWGGWVTGRTARTLAEDVAEDAVVERLALICVYQFNQDPAKAAQLAELKETSSYQRRTFVQDQGWATVPGEEAPDRKVAEECVKLLMLINP
jgi:pimeloyl-ACP methyl ester carboxylesterase